MRILDIATGRGEPAIRAALAVSPGGSVLGFDLDKKMLDMRDNEPNARNRYLELFTHDAQMELPSNLGKFDAVLAPWGIMYMNDPISALRAARNALFDNRRLVAAFWAEPERVSYFPGRGTSFESTRPSTRLTSHLPDLSIRHHLLDRKGVRAGGTSRRRNRRVHHCGNGDDNDRWTY